MANSDYVTGATGYFTPYAATAGGVAHLDALIDITGFSTDRATNPQPGDMIIIGEEVLALVSFTTDQIEVKRGVADTLPAAHDEGATVWFVESRIGTDSREYAGNATLSVKVLPKTTSQTTPVAKSPPQQITLASRFARPYPPANLQIDGEPWFSATPRLTAAAPSIEITWAHRNRVLQADQLIGHTEGSVSPEVGQTYRLRFYDAADALRYTESGITAASYTFTRDTAAGPLGLSALTDTGDVAVRVVVDSQRDGYSSWQAYDIDTLVDTTALGQSMSLTVTDADDTLTASMGLVYDLSLIVTDADDTLSAEMAPAAAPGVTADNLVFELLASKYTSGQTWANQTPAPHDGSAQTAYDFALGATTGSESSDPSIVGSGTSAYFSFDGDDYFTQIAAATAFTKAMHKAGSKFTIELWMEWAGTAASNIAPLFDSGTSDHGGSDMSRGVIYGDLGNFIGTPGVHRIRIKTNSGGTNVLSAEASAIASGSLQMLAASFDGTGAQQSFLYKNGAYDPVGSNNTWDGTLVSPGTLDATNSPRIGARGDGAFRVPSGTKLYGLRVYDTNLSKAQLDANYAAGVGVSVNDTP